MRTIPALTIISSIIAMYLTVKHMNKIDHRLRMIGDLLNVHHDDMDRPDVFMAFHDKFMSDITKSISILFMVAFGFSVSAFIMAWKPIILGDDVKECRTGIVAKM